MITTLILGRGELCLIVSVHDCSLNMLLIVLHAVVTGNLEMMNMAFIGNVDLTQDQESLITTHIIPIFPSVKV